MARDSIPGAERHEIAIVVHDGAGSQPLFKAELTFAVQRFR
jgi:hypothetical protein